MTTINNIDEFVEFINEDEDTAFSINACEFNALREDDRVTLRDLHGGVIEILHQDDCYLPTYEELLKESLQRA
ncbi:hypothetical protein CIG2463D_1351 [Campylobacter iguaniorum]|uniref:hypothetical protein n=1 Tax=Campylobacter iguaniorum TaxID=1244531 RepID=UPI00073A2E3D|nr:hypothetical protein [Campylobacter iguaniorum]ALV24920.1 hypothetical protein CIG2463D_1351 [Campylobacter iguaniorum]